MNFYESLQWRYATKQMNGEKISDDKRNKIVDAMRMAPTSMGTQPFQILVVQDPEMKAKLSPAISNQPQIEKSDCVIILAALSKYDEQFMINHIENTASIRNMDKSLLDGFLKSLKNFCSNKTDEQFSIWADKQAYIALGFGLAAAAVEQVDSTPMEGFSKDAVDEVLGLKERQLHTSVILTLGMRDVEKDYLVNAKKVRRSVQEIIEYI